MLWSPNCFKFVVDDKFLPNYNEEPIDQVKSNLSWIFPNKQWEE